jgi:PleD family two-component response regulator
LVLAPGVGGAALVQLAETLRTGVSSTPIVAADHEITITCSIGVATPNLEQETMAEAINRADQAHFQAVNRGHTRETCSCGLILSIAPTRFRPCQSHT